MGDIKLAIGHWGAIALPVTAFVGRSLLGIPEWCNISVLILTDFRENAKQSVGVGFRASTQPTDNPIFMVS
ncbi:MAG: hypothetical protein EBE86_006750 [Hormoscilla sp. GUM202]|nr:hypothetical protein [Hormoscilla sp. GUM202]